jgi:hypothetical protein
VILLETYYILFLTNIQYSYASGNFKHTGLILLSSDGRGMRALEECIENELRYLDYKLLLPYYFGLEVFL